MQWWKKLFSPRNVLGSLLFLTLVGEVTVGYANNLFNPSGFWVLFFLYLTLFTLYESLIVKYRLVVWQLLLINFALYSVFVTGFLNKEIADYVLRPQDVFITTLIRIQSAMYPIYAYYLINKWKPHDERKVLKVKSAVVLFAIYILIMSTSGVWGLPRLVQTLTINPGGALLFIILAYFALLKTRSYHAAPTIYQSKTFTFICTLLLLLGLIPSIWSFFILLFIMIITTLRLLINPKFRNHAL